MPDYNFDPQFAPLVESGQKRQTIRRTDMGATRGATAYLHTGKGTAQFRKLGEGTITEVLPIEIGRQASGALYAIIERGGERIHLMHEQLDSLARDDGFANGEEMAEWLAAARYDLPFRGYLHRWVPSNTESAPPAA